MSAYELRQLLLLENEILSNHVMLMKFNLKKDEDKYTRIH